VKKLENTKKLYGDLFKTMYTIRTFEEKVVYMISHSIILGPTHVYIGQEAVAAGVCANLNVDDYIVSTHRGHGHCIAKGVDLNKMMAELWGKATGCCKGKGGSMHITDFSLGMLGANGIVGAGIPIATGAGLASKLRRDNKVTVCFFGDGAINEGSFHEAANMAALWGLPVVFVCENNLYGMSCPIEKGTLVRDLHIKAGAFGMRSLSIDGNNVIEVYETFNEVIRYARQKMKPVLVECKTYRWMGHNANDPRAYRTREEEDAWKEKCPIKHLEGKMLEQKIFNETEIAEMKQDIEEEIKQAIEFAENSPDPEKSLIFEDVYA